MGKKLSRSWEASARSCRKRRILVAPPTMCSSLTVILYLSSIRTLAQEDVSWHSKPHMHEAPLAALQCQKRR